MVEDESDGGAGLLPTRIPPGRQPHSAQPAEPVGCVNPSGGASELACSRRVVLLGLERKGVPACPRPFDHRLRLLHGRDALARTPLCALLHRARQSARALRGLHREPRRTLDDPASPSAWLVTLRASDIGTVPDPRPRQQVQSRLRRGFPKRRDRDHPHPISRTTGKRVRRTLGRHRPPQLPRLAPDQQPQTTRACPPRLCRPLQHPQATSRSRTDTTDTRTSPTPRRCESTKPTPPKRPTRRPDPRIRPSSMTDEFAYPTRNRFADGVSCFPSMGSAAGRISAQSLGSRRGSKRRNRAYHPQIRCRARRPHE